MGKNLFGLKEAKELDEIYKKDKKEFNKRTAKIWLKE